MEEEQKNQPAEETTPYQPVSREESILKSASVGVSEVDDQPDRAVQPPVPPKKSHKKAIIIAIVTLIVLGAGASAYFMLSKESSTTDSSKAADTPAAQEKPAVATYEADKVTYAYKTSQANPYTMYYRPAAGGERKEATKLPAEAYPGSPDIVGQTAAFVSTDNKVYVSTDGGVTYSVKYQPDATEVITELKISSDQNRIAFSTNPTEGEDSSGTIYSVNTSGKDKQTVFKSTSGKALFVLAYSASDNKLAYSEGCYGCDGPRTAYRMYDIKAKTSKDILPGVDIQSVQYNATFSDDLSSMVYVQSTIDEKIKVEGLPGYYDAAPYMVKTLDIKTLKATTIETIGKKSEKNANGTDRYRQFYIGFLAGTNTAYYAEGKTLNIVDADKPKLHYTFDATVTGVHYVSQKTVIASTEKTTNDFLLNNYDVAAKKATLIFEGDANTVLVGVTTK